jgi:hypothetical protein
MGRGPVRSSFRALGGGEMRVAKKQRFGEIVITMENRHLSLPKATELYAVSWL